MFKIPNLLSEKERLERRGLGDITEKALGELDRVEDSDVDTLEGFENEEREYIKNTNVFYRKISIMDPEDLNNGMKIQIRVSDPKDPKKFSKVDQVMLYKFEGNFYATGSF